jgi:ferredoxin
MPASITVHPDRCMRQRFTKNSCERCVEVCPKSAVSLDSNPTVGSACSECGLCLIACPTEVFESYPDTDELLLRQARAVLDPGQKPLIVRCHEARPPDDDSLAVECLGSMSENTLVGAALLGFQKLILVTGSCAHCSMSQGSDLLESSMRISDSLVRRLGLSNFSVERVERPKTGASCMGRRQIFSTIGNRFRTSLGAAAIDCGPSVSGEESPHRPFEGRLRRRALLLGLLADASWGDPAPVSYEATLPWGMLTIDEGSCTACGICVSVCPTSAITQATDGGRYALSFAPSECINCRLCDEACPEAAIEFEDEIELAEIFTAGPEVVAKLRLEDCAICGDDIPSGKSTICATCDKRKLSATTRHFAGANSTGL